MNYSAFFDDVQQLLGPHCASLGEMHPRPDDSVDINVKTGRAPMDMSDCDGLGVEDPSEELEIGVVRLAQKYGFKAGRFEPIEKGWGVYRLSVDPAERALRATAEATGFDLNELRAKARFTAAVERLVVAIDEVNEAYQLVPGDLGAEAYPFEKSFDEYPLAVREWLEALKK